MSEPQKLRHWAYVERPLDEVRNAFREQSVALIEKSTRSATERVQRLIAALPFHVPGIGVDAAVQVHIDSIHEDSLVPELPPITVIEIRWDPVHSLAIFPYHGTGTLSLWEIAPSETMVEVDSEYRPVLGVFGHAFDAAVGHRIAEAGLQRFLDDLLKAVQKTG